MALTTAAEVKELLRKDPFDTDLDALIAQELPKAEAAVQDYTHRTFALVTGGATPQDFTYEESGVVTVADFQHNSITSVAVVDAYGTATTLTAGAYLPQPLSGEFPVGWWLEVSPTYGQSPEMGFLQNADVYARERGGYWTRPQRLRVTAIWGWPDVPGAVSQAAAWTVINFMESPKPYTAEAIAGYSRSLPAAADAVPERAKDLLGPYVKD